MLILAREWYIVGLPWYKEMLVQSVCCFLRIGHSESGVSWVLAWIWVEDSGYNICGTNIYYITDARGWNNTIKEGECETII